MVTYGYGGPLGGGTVIKSILRRLKYRLANWLLGDVPIERLRVIDLHVGPQSMKITPTSIVFHPNTANPSSTGGQMWYRSDLGRLVFDTGAGILYVATIASGAGAPTGTPPAYTLYIDTDNQILYYYDGSAWVPFGAVYK